MTSPIRDLGRTPRAADIETGVASRTERRIVTWAPLLRAFASAAREEIAAATRHGPPPAYHKLRELSYLGFSQLLAYRRA